ncbi:MAG: DUF58 domain-containing protein [Gemmatimonadetes bacterium]|nr:DUF58 domain-containing protein [Gemmatimonadota bacterium]
MLLAAVLADALRVPGSGQIGVERHVPTRLGLGASAEVTLRVRNDAAYPVQLQLTDDLPPELVRKGADTLQARVPAHRSVDLSYAVCAERRGDWTVGDLHLRRLGPLGLLWHQRRIALSNPVRVQPGLLDVRRYRLLGLRDRHSLGARSARQRGEGLSFESLREYVPGDDPRRIDWKATARRGAATVRQFEAERSQNVLLMIDAGRLMSERIGGRERLDHALAAALLLADVAGKHGDRVGAFVFADRVQRFLPPARTPLARLADALGGTEARPVEPDYPGAFTFLAGQLRKRSLLVLFTDVIDPDASAALVGHLAAAARRHLPLVVALRNPELESAAVAPVQGEADVFTRAAAEELLGARSVALAAMHRAGVLVADTRPSDAVPVVVNRYLEVKQRGLL